MPFKRHKVEDGIIDIPPWCLYHLPPWCPLPHLKVNEPILPCGGQVGFLFSCRDTWYPSKRLYACIPLQWSFRKFPKGLARDRPRRRGIQGAKTVEHLQMLLNTALNRRGTSHGALT